MEILDGIQLVFNLTAGADHLVEISKKILQALGEDSNPRPLIQELIGCMPGPLTPQKMEGIDEQRYNLDKYADSCYGKLLQELILCFKTDWLRKYGLGDGLKQLFVVESGTDIMFHESLLALCDGMKSCQGPCVKLDFILDMFKHILSSDFLASAVVYGCKQVFDSEVMAESYVIRWEDTVQLLVSLPIRVANKLKGKMDRYFSPDIFTKVILTHVAKCLVYLSKIKKHVQLNVNPISLLLSRVITNFKLSSSLTRFFEIVNAWCIERDNMFCDVVAEVLKRMETTSIEMTALLVLKVFSENAVLCVLSSDYLEISTWKYTLCHKIPMLTFNDDARVITNLVAFIGCVTNTLAKKNCCDIDSRSVLPILLLELLSVWGDKACMSHTSQDQHLYISKIIVLGFNYLCNCVKIPIQSSLKVELQTKLFQGMPSHLETTTESVRVMGMITAECVVYHLNKLVTDKDKRAELTFDFSKLKRDHLTIVEAVKSMSEFKFNVQNFELPKGDDLLDDMIRDTKSEELLPSQTVHYSSHSKYNKLNEINKTNDFKEDSESELDSDDDLVPYDLSNDVKSAVMKRPKYLRDLIEGFREENNIDVWVGSLEVCEALIYKQLPQDDETLGIEILDILLSLEKKVYCENFDSLRFCGAVAVVVVCPDAGAQFLCEQFHQDIGKYSIAQRMLMLDVLSAAAKVLSSPKNRESQVPPGTTLNNTVTGSQPEWYGIVKARIESHTRKFHQPKKPCNPGVKNKFSNVAGSFLFPLLRGHGKSSPGIVYQSRSETCTQEESYLLLVHFLKTCALIVAGAVNSPAATRMGKELLEATWSLRFHKEARVREAVIACVAAVVFAVPSSILYSELYVELVEARLWLGSIVESQGIIAGRSCEVDEQCRAFAAQVVILIGDALSNKAVM